MSDNESYILVLNCGSSSVKFAIIAPNSGNTPLSGIAENLFSENASLKYEVEGEKHGQDLPVKANHTQALNAIVDILTYVENFQEQLVGVGHRVVHGGEFFSTSVLIDDAVVSAITQTSSMAPLHNPANLQGIKSAQLAFPHLPHVAVFDTAFFQTLPAQAYLYALPYSLYSEHGIRAYGFHGTSHYFVSHRAALMLNKDYARCNIITAHLGNGCSIAAIKQGKAVDTSMGFTPLEGLIMGTRSGDIDPSVPGFLINQLGYTATKVDTLLNKESGLKGISQLTNDCRELEEQASKGNQQAQLALDMFCYRLVKYIGAYMAVVGPLDALVFTGGIGENSSYVRHKVLVQLAHLGIVIDEDLNAQMRFGNSGIISTPQSLCVMAIPTNEELVIAQDTAKIAL